MRVVFFGSPMFALPSLELIYKSEKLDLVGVFSQPAKKVGRKMQLKDTVVSEFAKQNNIPLFNPTKIDDDAVEKLRQLKPDLACVVSYGLILPKKILEVCDFVNLHPSSLPRFRGAAPLQYTLINGDKTTDICIMEVQAGIDTGDVYKRVAYDIPENCYLDEHHDRMSTEGARHLLDVVENWSEYKNKGVPQIEEGAVYAHKITKEDQQIDFNKDATSIYNLIRGISPVPGAVATLNGINFKVFKSEIINPEDNSYAPGEIIKANSKDGLQVACGNGIIRLTKIQKPGKKPMDDTVIVNGTSFIEGDCFE